MRLTVAGVYQLTAYPQISLAALTFMARSCVRAVTEVPTPVDAFTVLAGDAPTEFGQIPMLILYTVQ